MLWRATFVLTLGLGLLLGCGDDGNGTGDGGMDAAIDSGGDGGEDTGTGLDSSRPDVGSPRDGGGPRDSGTPDGATDAGADADAGPLTATRCFADAYTSTPPVAPDYESFMATIGSHCFGTNHQDITGVERVVFLGDSVTVGTPPSLTAQFYRSIVADGLVSRFGLSAPSLLWKQYGTDGTSLVRESGDFASCAKWGGNNVDLLSGDMQIQDCFPASSRDQRTLVIVTMGGNDIASITEDGVDGVPIADIWNDVRQFVQDFEDAIVWLKEPGRFSAGIDIVFANMFEFTDGSGDVTACPAAELAGFSSAWPDPSILADMVVFAEEQYMRIAVETGSDMIFLLEEFCGHGFNHTDASAPCYRGPGTPRWFDLSCTHPNPDGHQHIADMFLAVVDE